MPGFFRAILSAPTLGALIRVSMVLLATTSAASIVVASPHSSELSQMVAQLSQCCRPENRVLGSPLAPAFQRAGAHSAPSLKTDLAEAFGPAASLAHHPMPGPLALPPSQGGAVDEDVPSAESSPVERLMASPLEHRSSHLAAAVNGGPEARCVGPAVYGGIPCADDWTGVLAVEAAPPAEPAAERAAPRPPLSSRGGTRPAEAVEPPATTPAPAVAAVPVDQHAFYQAVYDRLVKDPASRLDNASYRNLMSDQAFSFLTRTGQDRMTYGEVTQFLARFGKALSAWRDPRTGEDAATLIYQASARVGINPMLLLTKLQVEQSLLSARELTPYQLDWALGVSVDGSGRSEKYRGFGPQLARGAEILAEHFQKASKHEYPRPFPGGVNVAPDNPFTGMLPTKLWVDNAATYVLFVYTPHTVASGSLANAGGGNYLFLRTFGSYFGSAALASEPYGPRQDVRRGT